MHVCLLRRCRLFRQMPVPLSSPQSNETVPLVDLNGDAPSCPPNTLQRLGVAFPSLVFTFALLAISSVILAFVTGFKFNSVRVFKKYTSWTSLEAARQYFVFYALLTSCFQWLVETFDVKLFLTHFG